MTQSNVRNGRAIHRAAERLACLITLCIVLCPLRAAAEPLDLSALGKENWIEVRTQHFNILCDAPEGTAIGIGRRLEQFTGMLQTLHPNLRAHPAQPVDIYIFRDQKQMARFAPSQVENFSAMANTGLGHSLFIMDGQVEGSDRANLVCHEFTHLFLNANFAEMPLWLNEGLAQYYATFRQRGSRAECGHPRDGSVYWLKTHEYADLNLLFAMKPEAAAYQGSNELRTTTYAQGWAITHYLMAAPDRATKMDSVLGALRKGTPARVAFRAGFPVEQWPQLIQDVKRYLKDDMLEPRSIPLPEELQLAATNSRPVGAAEAFSRLGEMLLMMGPDRLADADTLCSTALAMDSTLARARIVAGYIADVRGASARAESCYVRAEAQAPGDARVALLAGLGTFVRYRRMHDSSPVSPSDITAQLPSARRHFELCLRAEPGNPEALGSLGLVALMEERVSDQEYRGLEVAVEALPARRDFAWALDRARELREGASSKQGTESAPKSSGGE
jgi:hypothetical protein